MIPRPTGNDYERYPPTFDCRIGDATAIGEATTVGEATTTTEITIGEASLNR